MPRPIIRLMDTRNVERVTVDASEEEDEENDEDEVVVPTILPTGARMNITRPRRVCGIQMRDPYGKPRVEMATESEANLTVTEVITQLVAESDARERDAPLPRRRRPAASTDASTASTRPAPASRPPP